MELNGGKVWLVIVLLALGTYLIRWSFLGLFGRKTFPEWVLRHLRYTPVAVLPGLVAPLVLWPEATGGEPDSARLAAALVTLALGCTTRNVLASILGGMATLYLALWILP